MSKELVKVTLRRFREYDRRQSWVGDDYPADKSLFDYDRLFFRCEHCGNQEAVWATIFDKQLVDALIANNSIRLRCEECGASNLTGMSAEIIGAFDDLRNAIDDILREFGYDTTEKHAA